MTVFVIHSNFFFNNFSQVTFCMTGELIFKVPLFQYCIVALSPGISAGGRLIIYTFNSIDYSRKKPNAICNNILPASSFK